MSAATYFSALPDPITEAVFYERVRTKRLLAWIVDSVLITLISAAIVPFTAFTGLFFFPFLMLVTGFLYRWWTIASGSATWGMRLFAIELRDQQGATVDSRTALLHTAGYTVSVLVSPLQLVSVLLMLISARKQGLTDHILGTAMIRKAL
jgi:uncharacterized RDD family membrane protein YckC